jgi:hypothetical protein
MNEERKEFHDQLKMLVKSEYEELFRILKMSEESYSENSNGIFFDIMAVSPETFQKMQKYMNFCMETRKNQTERIKQLECITHEVIE